MVLGRLPSTVRREYGKYATHCLGDCQTVEGSSQSRRRTLMQPAVSTGTNLGGCGSQELHPPRLSRRTSPEYVVPGTDGWPTKAIY